MQIKLLTSRAGVGFSQARGEIIEVSDDEAARMMEAGQAEAVVAVGRSAPVERAVKRGADVEKAVR